MATPETKLPGRIVNPKIRFISLCPAGKNRVRGLYKSADHLQIVTKQMNERGELHALIYPAGRLDADQEWADAETVRKMAHDYISEGGQIDIRHNEQPVGSRVQLVESYIVKANDPDWPGHEGAWAGVLRFAEGDSLRDVYRSGAWGGVSIGGTAQIERGVAPPSLFAKAAASQEPNSTPTKEQSMDETALRALLKENAQAQGAAVAEAVSKAVSEAIAKAMKPEPAKDPAPVSLDPTNRAQVEKHLAELKKQQLLKSLDLNSVDSLEAHLQTFTAVSKEDKASNQPPESTKSVENRTEIAKGISALMDGGE